MGRCFFSSTSVLVRFLSGAGCCLAGDGLASTRSNCKVSYLAIQEGARWDG